MGAAAPRQAPRFAAPSSRFRASFLEALEEFQAEGRHAELDAARLADPAEFARFVAALRADARDPGAAARYLARTFAVGLDAPGYEYVPQTVLWWAAGDEYLGRLAIRHRLTPDLAREGGNIGYEVRPGARRRGHATAMLAAALPLAAGLGVDPAHVDCDAANLASRRVIEKNGGRLRREEHGCLYFVVPTR